MSRYFLLYIFFLLLTQNSSENTRPTLSSFNQELININEELKFVKDPYGALLHWLVKERLKYKGDLEEKDKKYLKQLKESAGKITNLTRDKGILKTDLAKIKSLLIACSYIDDYEDTMDSEFSFPSEQEMIKQINDPDKRELFQITIAYDSDPNNKKESQRTFNFNKLYTNIHEIKWLHYLIFCKSRFAQKIRNLLKKNYISVLNFCNIIGKIHELTSSAIHVYSDTITPEELKYGLKLNRILDDGVESCLDVLLAIKKEEALYKGTLSTLGAFDE